MNFKYNISRFVLGKLTHSDLPKVASDGIREGFESESLNILAGMSSKDNSFELEQYFRMAMGELGMELPDQYSASVQVARHYLEEIRKGNTPLLEGVRLLLLECQPLGSVENKSPHQIFYTNIHDLYYSYSDQMDIEAIEKHISNRMEELTKELSSEIEEWRDLMDHE